MTTADLLAELESIQSTFRDRSRQEYRLDFRLIEAPGPTPLGSSRPDSSELEQNYFCDADQPERYSALPDPAAPGAGGRFVAEVPPLVHWTAEFRTNDECSLPEFEKLARPAWVLLTRETFPIPQPASLVDRLAHFPPNVRSILPAWGEDYIGFAHFVAWLGQSGDHPLYGTERRTWADGEADQDRPGRLAMHFYDPYREPTPPVEERPHTPGRFYSDVRDLMLASSWAVAWLKSRIEAERGARPLGASNPVGDSKGKGEDGILTVDDRALTLLHRYLSKGEPYSVAKIAENLGVSRQHLYRCPKFQALLRVSARRLPQGNKDAKTRTVEAFSDDD